MFIGQCLRFWYKKALAWTALLAILWMCSFRDSLRSTVTPSISLVCGTQRILIWMMGFFLLAILKNSHFCGLKVISQECDHCASEFRSYCRAMQSTTELRWEYKRTSSAYSLIRSWTQAGKSFMYIKKSRGVNMVPWGTLERTSLEWLFLWSNTTYCDLLLRHDLRMIKVYHEFHNVIIFETNRCVRMLC